jgi:4-carboxymuconolactone decarboxylase
MAEVPSKKYRQLEAEQNEFMRAMEALGQATKQAGPINDKSAQLVQLAAAAAIRSEGAVHSHTRRALQAGATAEEIKHALILLTSTIGFPSVVAALTWAGDIIEDNP